MKMKKLKYKYYTIEADDGSRWAIPVEVIAENRANYYKDADEELEGDFEKSLNEDTIPFFNEDPYNIHDWASGNMDWDDVKEWAVQIPGEAVEVDWQEFWVNGDYDVLENFPDNPGPSWSSIYSKKED